MTLAIIIGVAVIIVVLNTCALMIVKEVEEPHEPRK